jgi:hypothetical protein
MGTYPITIVVVLAGAFGVIFLLRFGIRQNAAAAAVQPAPDASGGLAVLSFVTALILPVVGVLLAHLTLARISRGEAGGRPFAYAALWVGYALIVLQAGAAIYLYQTNYWS